MTGAVDMIALSGHAQGAAGVAGAGNDALVQQAATTTRNASTREAREAILEQVRSTIAEANATPVLAGEEIETTTTAADAARSSTQRQLNTLTRSLQGQQAQLRARFAASGVALDDGVDVVQAEMAAEADRRAQDIQAEGGLRERALRSSARRTGITAHLREQKLLAESRSLAAQDKRVGREAAAANLFALAGRR